MKKLLFIITAILLTLPSLAQENNLSIVIEKEGTSQEIAFDQLQRITFSGTTVNMFTKDGSTVSNDMYDIYRIGFNETSTNISSNTQEGDNLLGYISNEAIVINSLAGTTIEIYNVNGNHISSTRLKSDNETISIASLPKGIYLVRTNCKTAKFLKR